VAASLVSERGVMASQARRASQSQPERSRRPVLKTHPHPTPYPFSLTSSKRRPQGRTFPRAHSPL